MSALSSSQSSLKTNSVDIFRYHIDELEFCQKLEAIAHEVDIISNEVLNIKNELTRRLKEDKTDLQLLNQLLPLLHCCRQPGELLLEGDKNQITERSFDNLLGNAKKKFNTVEPQRGNLLSRSLELISSPSRRSPSPSSGGVFATIEKLCCEISRLESNDDAIRSPLARIKKVYIRFMDEYTNSNDKQQSCLKNRIQILIPSQGWRYLAEDAANYILSRDNRTKMGSHTVWGYKGVYLKRDPKYPGIEKAIYSLNRIISNHGSPPTQLIKYKQLDKQYPYLASKSIEGVNLKYLIVEEKNLKDHEKPSEEVKKLIKSFKNDNWMEKINPFNFSTMIVSSILTNPTDGRSDNYVVTKNGNQYEIIGIDNDMAFSSGIEKGSGSQHRIGVFCILFFFNNLMTKHVDDQFINYFLSKTPELIIIQWLNELAKNNYNYQQLLDQKIFTTEEYDLMKLPVKITPSTPEVEGWIKSVRAKAQSLQEVMRRAQQTQAPLTNWDLLCHTQEVVAKYYQKFKESRHCQNNHELIEGLRFSGNSAPPSIETLLMGEKLVTIQDLASFLETQKLARDQEEKYRTQTVEDALADFTKDINWSEQTEQTLDALLEATYLETIYFNNCHYLKEKHLERINTNFKNLKKIVLLNCSNVSASGLCALLKNRSDLLLEVGQCSKLSVKDYLLIKQQIKQGYLHLVTGEKVPLNSKSAKELHSAISAGDLLATKYFLSVGVHPNSPDALGYYPLHKALQASKNLEETKSIMTTLVFSGSSLNARFNHLTPLEFIEQKISQNDASDLLLARELAEFAQKLTNVLATGDDLESLSDYLPKDTFIDLGVVDKLTLESAKKLIEHISPVEVGLNQKMYAEVTELEVTDINSAIQILNLNKTFGETKLLLTELSLSESNLAQLETSCKQSLLDALKGSKIRKLDLSACNMSNSDMNLFFSSIAKLPLNTLDLSYNSINDLGAQLLANLLESLPIQELNLERTEIKGEGMKTLIEAVTRSSVQELNIRNNNIQTSGAQAIAQAASRFNTNFRLLIVNLPQDHDANQLGEEGKKVLSNAQLRCPNAIIEY